jgi:hypothetical protein
LPVTLATAHPMTTKHAAQRMAGKQKPAQKPAYGAGPSLVVTSASTSSMLRFASTNRIVSRPWIVLSAAWMASSTWRSCAGHRHCSQSEHPVWVHTVKYKAVDIGTTMARRGRLLHKTHLFEIPLRVARSVPPGLPPLLTHGPVTVRNTKLEKRGFENAFHYPGQCFKYIGDSIDFTSALFELADDSWHASCER